MFCTNCSPSDFFFVVYLLGSVHTRYEKILFKQSSYDFCSIVATVSELFFCIVIFTSWHSICDFTHCKCCTESSYYLCASHSAYKKVSLRVLTQNKKICVVDYDMNSIIYSTLMSVIAKVFTWNNNISHD